MRILRHGAWAVAMATLVACKTVGPDYHLPATAVINRPQAGQPFLDTAHDAALDPRHAAPDAWWTLYDDPVLNELVQQALTSNAGLRVATANLHRAYALYDQARTAGGFTYGASGSATRAQISAESYLLTSKLPVYNLASLAFNASYEIDLFGKLKRGAEAAQAESQAGEAALDLARITVVAQAARSYVANCHITHEIGIAQRSLNLQLQSVAVAKRLLDAGRGTPVDLARAAAQADLLRASLPALQARRKAEQYMLAALLGHTPGDIPATVEGCGEAPTLTQPIPIGNGMTLLQRRPDVRESERRLAAATARIGIAVADLYPDVQLGASVGSVGLLSDFNTSTTRGWSIGPLISWTFPSNSARARIRVAEAGADAALAEFDQTVLAALRDTQIALENYAQELDRQSALHRAADEARQAAEQNSALYRGGRTPYLTSLDADRTLASAEATAAEADAQVSLDQITVFLALGGGWQQR